MNRRHRLGRFLWLAVAVIHLLAGLTFAHATPWRSPAQADTHSLSTITAEARTAADCHQEASHKLSDCGMVCTHCVVCNFSGGLLHVWSPERLSTVFLSSPPPALAVGFPTPQLRPPSTPPT